MKNSFALLCAGLLLLIAGNSTHADNWPQWRGGNHDGISKETGIPSKWDKDTNIAWKYDLPGKGSSTPAVWGKHIFLTCQDGENLVLLAISTAGKELWKRTVGKSPFGKRERMYRFDEGNDASPSPSTDGKHVYAFVGSGDFACFDFEGKEKWRFEAQKRYGKFRIQFGMHTTPVLHGNRIYLQLIHSGGAWVVAINKADGTDAWKVERKSDGTDECEHSYASPCLWQKGKQAYLITHGNDYAIAHQLDNGKEIWRVGGLNPKNRYNVTLRFVATPVATPDLIVIPSAKNGPVVGLKPDAKGKVMPGDKHEQWRLAHNTPDVPSPLVHDGLVYLCREFGEVMCLDAKTGQEKYKRRIASDRYRGSPVYADGKIFLSARRGTVTVLKAGAKFEKVAENKLPGNFAASPAIAGGRIYLRGFNALYAIGSKER